MPTCSWFPFTTHTLYYTSFLKLLQPIDSKGEVRIQYWATDMWESYKIWIKSDINSIQFNRTASPTGQEGSLGMHWVLETQQEIMWEMWMCLGVVVCAQENEGLSKIHSRKTDCRWNIACILLVIPPSKHSLLRFKPEQTLTCRFKSVYICLGCGPSLSALIWTGLLGEVRATEQ